jgi:secreted Zn-dependent insulinase-like peptidase
VNDSLNEFAYDAELAGLCYNFAAISTGLYVSVSGYDDKISILTRNVAQKIRNLEVRPDKLEIMKEKVGVDSHRHNPADVLFFRSSEAGRISFINSHILSPTGMRFMS